MESHPWNSEFIVSLVRAGQTKIMVKLKELRITNPLCEYMCGVRSCQLKMTIVHNFSMSWATEQDYELAKTSMSSSEFIHSSYFSCVFICNNFSLNK
jgi:hypothetical protein